MNPLITFVQKHTVLLICVDCCVYVRRLIGSLFEDVWTGDWNVRQSSIVIAAGKDIVENVWSSSSNKLEASLKHIPIKLYDKSS